MKVSNLRCEYRENPLGIDTVRPRLSWTLTSNHRGRMQTAYQICSADDEEALYGGEGLLWDSGKVESSESVHILYGGEKLRSRQRVYWRIRAWDENDQPSAWSTPGWFEGGLLEVRDWAAQWIGNPLTGGPRTPVPSPYFRREFSVSETVKSARLYITSLGIYEAYLNGERVGDDVFAPGWTDYGHRVQYQTYDVTTALQPGQNVIGALLGDGWYCGHVGWEGRQNYGDRPKLLAQLEITFNDGSKEMITSDDQWLTAVGPQLEADLMMGEAYDARLELESWNQTEGFEPEGWVPALTFSHAEGMALAAQNTPTVRVQEELPPISEPDLLWGWPEHDWIFDFGQNLVGRVRLKVKGERGTTIILRYGEMLDEDGKLYTENLRSARQADFYTLKGDPEGEIYEPRFTFHGFRYVEVNGLVGKPERDLLTAVVLHSDNAPAIEFECSDPLVNQLHHNIQWGWKGNSVDVPTDCPQRDERLGWTGDAQVFAKTATYLCDSAGFFSKWIQDMADAQFDYGAIPAVAPVTPGLNKSDGGAAWSDAFIIVPWTVWQQYGDTHILETHYEAMCGYMDYLIKNSPDLIRMLPDERELGKENEDWQIGGYGDWLAQDGNTDKRGLTPKALIGTAFLAYDAKLMSEIAAAIGQTNDAKRFEKLYADTREAFIRRFITPDGLVVGQTQTGYVLALHFGLVPDHLKSVVSASLVEDIEVTRKGHMSTGFVGTPYITQVLTDIGRPDLAYRLLLQKTYPSWLYSVVHGATTIWERWDGWTEEKGFQDPGMNSFNHYAYGAVGTWFYENTSGIRTDPESPGFKRIHFAPKMDPRMSYARCAYLSPYGLIESNWKREDGKLVWKIVIPPNTCGVVSIPAKSAALIREGDYRLAEVKDLAITRQTGDVVICEVKSGKYQFVVDGA